MRCSAYGPSSVWYEPTPAGRAETRRDEAADPDRPGRRDMDDARLLLLDEREHVGDQREVQLQLLVGRERQRPVVRERVSPGCSEASARAVATRRAKCAACSFGREPSHRSRDAVRLVEGVGEDQASRLAGRLVVAEERRARSRRVPRASRRGGAPCRGRAPGALPATSDEPTWPERLGASRSRRRPRVRAASEEARELPVAARISS